MILSVKYPADGFSFRPELARSPFRERFGHAGHQDLAGTCQRHQPSSDRLSQALHFHSFRAPRDVGGRVVPRNDVADMNTYARAQRVLGLLRERSEFMLVLKREGHRFDRPIEQYEETI